MRGNKSYVRIGRKLRRLIRAQRRDKGLRDKSAEKGGDYYQSWLRGVEQRYITQASADKLAEMCEVIGLTPDQVRRTGHYDVASLMERVEQDEGLLANATKAYLMATPGMADYDRAMLVHYANDLRSPTPAAT